jgi:hypothetical protein
MVVTGYCAVREDVVVTRIVEVNAIRIVVCSAVRDDVV